VWFQRERLGIEQSKIFGVRASLQDGRDKAVSQARDGFYETRLFRPINQCNPNLSYAKVKTLFDVDIDIVPPYTALDIFSRQDSGGSLDKQFQYPPRLRLKL
jgi:hypothetical protein